MMPIEKKALAFAAALLVLWLVFKPESKPEPIAVAAHRPAPRAQVASPQPVSDGCRQLAEAAESNGIIRTGGMDHSGATLLVDRDWARMDFDTQRMLAECLSHYIGGGQDRWVKRIRFVHQASGTVLGTMENTRYRVGE